MLDVTHQHFSGVLNGRIPAGRKLGEKLELLSGVPLKIWFVADPDTPPATHPKWVKYASKHLKPKKVARVAIA